MRPNKALHLTLCCSLACCRKTSARTKAQLSLGVMRHEEESSR